MHAFFPFIRHRVLAVLLLGLHTSTFCQNADSTPLASNLASTPVKYIFYWGSLQCDLTEANGYKGAMSTTIPTFRQILLSTPRLWNGSSLVKEISFQLEKQPVNTAGYVSLIGHLDSVFGQKILHDQVLHLTDLTLEGQKRGSITILVTEPEKKKDDGNRGGWMSPPASYLNERYLERVVWGREDISEISNRDFFNETEFWQTVRQQPIVEWKKYATPEPVSARILFPDLGNTAFGLVAKTEEAEYYHLVENLENYRHLIHPGATISLALQTAEQHDELFQKRIILVPDNDFRLALRRNRDAHQFRFRWGDAWQENISPLYLIRKTDKQGNAVDVDPPIGRPVGFSKTNLLVLLRSRPEIRIDDQLIPEFSFRVSKDSNSVWVEPGGVIPESFVNLIEAGKQERGIVQIDSVQVSGYDLPALTFFLNYFDQSKWLLVKNDLNTLLSAQGSARIKLSAPTLDKTDFYFDFSMPEQARANISIFEPNGWNNFISEEQFSAGMHTMKVSRSVFRNAGKHFCFLNTPFGVTKVEFVVP